MISKNKYDRFKKVAQTIEFVQQNENDDENKSKLLVSMNIYSDIWDSLYCKLEGSLIRVIRNDESINMNFLETALNDFRTEMSIYEVEYGKDR